MDFANSINKYLGMVQPDVNLEVVLIFNEKEYQLEQFNMNFSQAVDHKGEPQSEVLGGTLLLKILQFPDDELLYWASNQWLKKTGEIIFRNKSGSAPMKVKFENAYCVEMHQNVNDGVETLFVISAQTLSVNEETHYNKWDK